MMEILIATVLAGVALLWLSTKTGNIAFQKLFAALGLLLFALVFLQASVFYPEERLANTTEDSLYWNCTRNVTDPSFCVGTPEPDACDPYNIIQCAAIAGCEWNNDFFCEGQPEIDSCAPYNETQCKGIPSCNWTEEEDPFCYGTPEEESCQAYNATQCLNIPSCWFDQVCWGTPDNCTVVGEYDPTGNKCANETVGCYWDLGTPGGCSGQVDNCTQLVPWGKDKCDETDGCNWRADTYCSGTPEVTCSDLLVYDPTGYKCNETAGCTFIPGATFSTNASCDSVNVTYNYEDTPGQDVISAGNIALFLIFGMVFLLALIWFAIDYVGIGINDMGQIVRQKREKR